ncbi:MAG: SDR family oxidoreductase [Anaerolineae bacterium]|nr:SDR family oxidoreductase [Anaerolineae bacterium]MDW8172948.1 SDR family oxidoreductase [Anaerolineae bacterium]
MRKLWLGLILAMGVAWWRQRVRQQRRIDLRGQVVMITGAGQGIGAETARLFAREGARLVLIDLQAAALARLQEELAPLGVETLTVAADITFEDSMEEAVRVTLETFGQLDILVNNAGLMLSGPFVEYDLERIQKVIDVNFYGLVAATRAALVPMRARGQGHIINVASASAYIPAPAFSVYLATKSAVVGLSESLRRELAAEGIVISYISPGWVRTAMTAHMDEAAMREAGLLSPIITILKPHEVAQAIVEIAHTREPSRLFGSFGWHLFSFTQRLSPALNDLLFDLLTQRERVLEIARGRGH